MIASTLLATTLMLHARPMPFAMSVQAWSFNPYTAFEAIERTASAGAKYIELFPGQKLKPGSNAGVGPGLTSSEQNELVQKLSKHGITPVAFGVTGIDKDYAKARPLFVWAKAMGFRVINTESTESIDTIDRLVKEFDISVGYHNHPKQPNNPNYKVWDPNYIYDLVKDHDKRIGACADTGHWVRSGIKPMDAIKILKGRIVSSHLKDLTEMSMNAADTPYGGGVSDIASILKAYEKMNLKGSVSVEYETNYQNNLNEVGQCIGFVKGFFNH